MRSRRTRTVAGVAASLMLLTVLGCSRPGAKTSSGQPTGREATAAPSATAVTPTSSPVASPSATPGDTPVAGATFKVGDWTVVVGRFRAQVSSPQGVNIRSSPEVNATNRTGSLAPGATVDVEGQVPQGQEAEPGNGTNWFYVGTVGSTPQFIYGPSGTLTPLSGSATPTASPSGSATATAVPATASATP
jgi:hypothetical protein